MKVNALEMLTAMNEAQSHQLMAASLLAIAVCMKKAGLQEISVTPDDFKLIEQGETLEPIPNVAGGFTYRFKKVVPPLAKKPVPDVVVKAMQSASSKPAKRAKHNL